MEGHCSTGQSTQWAVVPMEEKEEQEEEEEDEEEEGEEGGGREGQELRSCGDNMKMKNWLIGKYEEGSLRWPTAETVIIKVGGG